MLGMVMCFIVSENVVTVQVHGVRPENMLMMVHEVIESLITDFYAGIQYEYKIPCPHCVNEVSAFIY